MCSKLETLLEQKGRSLFPLFQNRAFLRGRDCESEIKKKKKKSIYLFVINVAS